MPEKLSVIIIAQNCDSIISGAIQSAIFADEVLVLDGGSVDKTQDVARQNGARVEVNPFKDFSEQKQIAVNHAKNNWVFLLDSDERISENLQNEIITLLVNPEFSGYSIPRINYFFGKPIRYGGLYPDRNIRLFNRSVGQLNNKIVHEKVILKGKTGFLYGDIIHLAYNNIDEFIQKQNTYSSMGAKHNKFKAIVSPLWVFLRIYLFKLGFLEGWHGFTIARLYSQYTFWKYAKKSPR